MDCVIVEVAKKRKGHKRHSDPLIGHGHHIDQGFLDIDQGRFSHTTLRRSHDNNWTWRPLEKARRKYPLQINTVKVAMSEQRNEVILRNLAHDLLTNQEYERFKAIIHQFRLSKSVPALCQHLRPIINTTEKLLLLVEISSRIPKSLQEDFHRICGLQFKNYETYLRIYSRGNALPDVPKVIAQDSSGKFKIVSRGSEKKFMVNSNHYKNYADLNSQHGTSVTSGIYSEHDETSVKHLDLMDGGDSDVFLRSSPGRSNHAKVAQTGTKRVFLRRRDDGSLGLGIDGGKEYGRAITVSVVDPEGPAAGQGLMEGDRIMEVNGTDFQSLTHAEAVTLMRNAWNIIMMVQASSNVTSYQENQVQIKDVELLVYPSDGKMGCSTNRRNKNNVLIVKSVDQNSPAEKAGLEEGDFITKIDGIDIRNLTEKQITSLTRSKKILVNIKRVNRPEGYIHSNHEQQYKSQVRNGHQKVERVMSSPAREKTHLNSRHQHHTDNRAHSLSDTDSDDDDNNNAHRRLSQAFGIMDFADEDDKKNDNVIDDQNSSSLQRIPSGSSFGVTNGDDNNWVLSNKAPPKMFQRRNFITAPNVITQQTRPTQQTRSRVDGYAAAQFQRRSRSQGRDVVPIVYVGGVRRYVRSRSQSPHYLQTRQQRASSRRDQDIMAAIQMGIEKRQRALRLSLYQTPDSSDLDWEM